MHSLMKFSAEERPIWKNIVSLYERNCRLQKRQRETEKEEEGSKDSGVSKIKFKIFNFFRIHNSKCKL